MTPSISFSRDEDTPQAKARWFQSLTPQERVDHFVEFMDFVIAANPDILKRKRRNAQSIPGRIRVLKLESL